MNQQHRDWLAAMGIEVWQRRSLDVMPAPGDMGREGLDDWEMLERQIRACRRCVLAEGRSRVVIGRGSRTADWLVIGEAPGAEEDRQGLPFVGPAGALLDRMLRAIELSEQDVYIANIVKCRPPGNRDPHDDEIAACHDYLLSQITLVQPRIILAVGRVAAQTLLGTQAPLSRLRGRSHRHDETGIPLIVTYHPAYLLRSPRDKGKVWQDLCLARRLAVAAGSEAG